MRCVTTELLFSYGTLYQGEVQLATFGRELAGRSDAIIGFELGWVTITDPHVIATSGSDRHPILTPSARIDAAVEGMVFAVGADDLAAADDHEVADYRRVMVPLRSGEQERIYVFAGWIYRAHCDSWHATPESPSSESAC